MPYIPGTDTDTSEMLATVGLKSMEELFSDLPEAKRFPKIDLPKPLSELEVIREAEALAAKNITSNNTAWFLGAGIYNHFVPSVVNCLSSRGEFLTAYTPYQPEVSQGTLQAIFEYQSMASELLGVDIVNASHYDGASAMAEAVIMALNQGGSKRRKVFIPEMLHPEYKAVLKTYLEHFNVTYIEWAGDVKDEASKCDSETACFVVAYPNFEGKIESLDGLADRIHKNGALFIVCCDPIMLGILKSPGSMGADIVTAEGQSLGNCMNFGGPLLGMMGTSKKYVRKMPGRIVGEAFDHEGRKGYVLTLSAREQHIRREKAVSNICSNQGLAMLNATIYMEALGKNGLKKVAELCWNKAHYAAELISKVPGYSVTNCLFFKEFVVNTPIPAQEIVDKLEKRGVVPGLALSHYFKNRTNELLVCVTEMNTKNQIDLLAECLKEASV